MSSRPFIAPGHDEAVMGVRLSLDSLDLHLEVLAASACQVPRGKGFGLSI